MADDPKGPLEELLATPLFADVDGELLDGVRAEAAIAAGSFWADAGEADDRRLARRTGFVDFRDLQVGEAIVAQGTLTTEFVVVLAGTLEAVQARFGREVYRHREYGPGDWFGEVSTHAHHAALATYRATTAAKVAVLEARLFRRLYAEDETFRERILDGYKSDLALHLRLSPLCKDLDDRAFEALQANAELVSFEDGAVVAAADDPADCVYLVRAGAIGGFVDSDAGERVLAYYKGNATFGEHTLVGDGDRWPCTFRALMASSLVRLPKRAFERLAEPARAGLRRAANRLIGRDDATAAAAGEGTALGDRQLLDELFVMVERESVKGGRALVIDRNKCVRCNMCVESCVAVHDDGIPRLSKVGTPVATDEVLVTACYHCETPQCMLSCEYAAIRRDPQGRIRFEYDNCVGCAGCIDGCPYGVIRLVEPKPAPPPKTLLQSLPLLGRLFGGSGAAPAGTAPAPTHSVGAGGKQSPIGGKTIKCDLCAGLPFEACVYNCPTTAIVRKQPQQLFDRTRNR